MGSSRIRNDKNLLRPLPYRETGGVFISSEKTAHKKPKAVFLQFRQPRLAALCIGTPTAQRSAFREVISAVAAAVAAAVAVAALAAAVASAASAVCFPLFVLPLCLKSDMQKPSL